MFTKKEHLITKVEHIYKAGVESTVKTLYQYKEMPLHLRDLVKKSGFSIQGTTRIVNTLVKKGLLEQQRIANLRRFKLNYMHPQITGILTTTDTNKIRKLPKLVQGALDEFCRAFDNQIIILFGSYAKGTYTPNSDIDIFVYVSKMPTKNPDISEINKKYGVNINPIFSDGITTDAQKHILNTGIPLTNHMRFYQEYGRNEKFSN